MTSPIPATPQRSSKSGGFIYDYFEGSMANPMIAACQNRETGRRALFLRGFADDREGKEGK